MIAHHQFDNFMLNIQGNLTQLPNPPPPKKKTEETKSSDTLKLRASFTMCLNIETVGVINMETLDLLPIPPI